MTQVDTLILAVIAISSAFGVWRGFIKETLSLLSWIAALLVSRVYSESLAGLLESLIDNPSVRYVTAFSVLFVLIIMLGTALNHFMSKLLVVTGLKTLDRLLGAVFGVARGAVIVLVVLFILNVFVSGSEWWQQSTLIPYGMVLIEESQIFIGDINAVSPTY
ncbi:MAG: CvpA family protein [Pseudohongiellaceae bacterium]